MNTFPPMLAVMDFFHYTTCMLSGVPLLSSDAEGRAVYKLSCVEKSNVSPHQRGAPGKSGAVSFSGTPADVPNSHSLCNVVTDIPKEQGATGFEAGARRLRVNRSPVTHSVSQISFCENVRVWSINCCKFLFRKAEIEARLRNSNVDILCLQET